MAGTHVAVPIPQVMGAVHLHVRTYARADTPSFSYLGNGWSDCAEISYVVRDHLARQLTQTKDGVHLHVCTCARADVPLLPYLGRCLNSGVGTIFSLGGGGAHLTSDVATDFRVLGRIHDLKTYLPRKFGFSSVSGHLLL